MRLCVMQTLETLVSKSFSGDSFGLQGKEIKRSVVVLAHPLSKLGESQSLRLLCPGLNLAKHTCEFCSLSRASGTPLVEGLAAAAVITIICALAPGFRQLSKASATLPSLWLHHTAKMLLRGGAGREAGRALSSLPSQQSREAEKHACLACAGTVCLPLCVAGRLCPLGEPWTQTHPSWGHCLLPLS